jgi:hypothetical protein
VRWPDMVVPGIGVGLCGGWLSFQIRDGLGYIASATDAEKSADATLFAAERQLGRARVGRGLAVEKMPGETLRRDQ